MKLAFLSMMVAAVAAAEPKAFLQMKMSTKRVSTKDDDFDDMTYGADGVSDAAMDDSNTLGAHEFLVAQDEDEVDSDDASDPDTAVAAADDEATNFGEDADDTEGSTEDEDSDEADEMKEQDAMDEE